MNPQNTIIGSEDNYGTDLPDTQIDREALLEEVRMAKFSKSKEFQKIKQYAEQRIEFYQKSLPDGRAVTGTKVTGEDWRIANAVIGEFQALLGAYENAREGLDGVQRKDT